MQLPTTWNHFGPRHRPVGRRRRAARSGRRQVAARAGLVDDARKMFRQQLEGGVRRNAEMLGQLRDLRAAERGAQLIRRNRKIAAVAQPAIVTASRAAVNLLNEIGIEAEIAVGHSLGELTALHWAGAFDGDTLLRIALARGQAMTDLGGDAAAAGCPSPEPCSPRAGPPAAAGRRWQC